MGCINSKDATDTHPPTTNPTTAQETPSVPIEAAGDKFSDHYQLGKMIGSGTFSVVREAIHKKTGQKYAIKCIKKDGLTAEDIEALTAEVGILKQMDHPNIMILHDFYSEDNYYYLVTEYMEGGELFDRIVEKSYYTEREARDLVKLLLEAIHYCHKNNVVHRDLKPENLLLTCKDDNASIKLADFGFAKKIEFDGDGLSTACGTPGYVAPEILHGKTYGKAVDIWSIGVITYILLCGYPPFHDDNHNALFRKIKKGKYQFDSPYWDHVSDDAKDLISKMLITDPEERATAAQLLEHTWVIGTEVATVQLTSALEELRRFNARRKFRAAVNTVQAANRLNKALSAVPLDGLNKPSADIQESDITVDVVDNDNKGETEKEKEKENEDADKNPLADSLNETKEVVVNETKEVMENASNVVKEQVNSSIDQIPQVSDRTASSIMAPISIPKGVESANENTETSSNTQTE